VRRSKNSRLDHLSWEKKERRARSDRGRSE
jgi:hypothetical protein